MQKGKPHWWDEANKFLLQDDLLGPIVKQHQGESLVGKGDLFATFVNSIVGQQISVIAADSIWNRLKEMVGEITPKQVSSFTHAEIAACGLTKSKATYILGVAQNPEAFLSPNWDELTDSEIHKHFVSFKGIGPWTAEMLMMFSLMRPDVFSLGDIGLVKAVKILVPEAETKEQVLEVADRWKPYRTAACWYLWRMLDPVPVAY
ncbi:MAG: DNA-3-methyladenine glycosylase [Euryarchaeota archaeon]|nr:DNA-3-methyladenine glycosylase [Euryarchaeota archaeon]|tara:strand:+ start:398 stop:1009 length:612 start_codon:yes stop_codon:yes gene_type:complete